MPLFIFSTHPSWRPVNAYCSSNDFVGGQIDSKGLESCLDVLKYALCATICLDMPTERAAFVTQLARVKFFKETRGMEDEEEAEKQRLQHDHQASVCGHSNGSIENDNNSFVMRKGGYEKVLSLN